MRTLKQEVKNNLLFLIDMDLKIYGHVSTGTLEAIKTQGYIFNKGKLIEVK